MYMYYTVIGYRVYYYNYKYNNDVCMATESWPIKNEVDTLEYK